MITEFDLQPQLENDIIKIRPLKEEDFDTLYQVASDPLIWEQHPNKDRYKKDVFKVFFEGAMLSKGAFIVYDIKTNMPIGSSRYYDLDKNLKTINIGYTFLSREYWGKNYNQNLKLLMINHAFKSVENIIFHIGANNLRSQKAILKLNANKIQELEIEYFWEQKKLNFVYKININSWKSEVRKP